MQLIKSETLYHHALCVYLRTLVFIQEQGYSIQEEIYNDEDEATYFLMIDNDQPVATGRYRVLEENTAQLERVCVAKEYRGKGYGAAVIEKILNDAQKQTCKKIVAFVKEDTFGLYERFGFDKLEEFCTFAGIPHCKIVKTLNG